MTQTMREQLQALVEYLKYAKAVSRYNDTDDVCTQSLSRLESILATPEPAVTVRKGVGNKGLDWHLLVGKQAALVG